MFEILVLRKEIQMERISVGVIGATGMVGQNYIRLLEGHPFPDRVP